MDAATYNRVEEIASLLRNHPDLNVNQKDEEGLTLLHSAALNNHVEVVKLLLAHPAITVNVQTSEKVTAFYFGCVKKHVAVIQVLLQDPRVDVTLGDDCGRTPLWWAAYWGHCELVEWITAARRDLGDHVKNKKGKWVGHEFTALGIARKQNKTEMMSLLERFMANQVVTRHEIRVKLGLQDELAAEIFALTVFLCDELLQLTTTNEIVAGGATRFFVIASKLPMELQMVLSHRAVGSKKQNILVKDSEAAFKSLATILLSESKSK